MTTLCVPSRNLSESWRNLTLKQFPMSKLVLTKVVNHTFVNENPLALIRPTNATTKKPFHQRDALFKTPQSSIISSMQYFFEQKLVSKKCHIYGPEANENKHWYHLSFHICLHSVLSKLNRRKTMGSFNLNTQTTKGGSVGFFATTCFITM